jgi:hypothetical protein
VSRSAHSGLRRLLSPCRSERTDGFFIVEKEGTAGRLAEANDPRG